MNKTLYVKDEDGPIWDKARELTGDKLSSFIMDKLRTFVSERAGQEQGYGRIVVQYRERGIPKAKAFCGRWIIPPGQPLRLSTDEPGGEDEWYIVAETAKGNYAVLKYWQPPEPNDDDEYFRHGDFLVFQRVEHIGQLSTIVASETMKRLGVQVQELDI